MEFSINHPILYVIAGVIIAAVLAQSFFFLFRAMKRAKELGMDGGIIKKTITSSAIFTIAPAVSILVGVVILSKQLGVALPWLRLSVVGSLSYETVASQTTIDQLNLPAGQALNNDSDYVTDLWVMTVGIAIGLLLVPLCAKRIQKGLKKMEKKDSRWGEIFNNAMFLGMISAFLGYVFCDVSTIFSGDTSGLIPVCVMAVSAILMLVCGLISQKCKIRWITDYALPISLIGGMAAAIPITGWLA
ncbi:MAG: DUF5058 family protein [Clostridia bacterium]|nr:DUF5058 family protein [Clostridia bacterium]